MKVEMWPIGRVKPYERNPRINDQAVDAVAASLRLFGFRQPIVVDGDGIIVAGHTRWKAAGRIGLEKVPVHVAKDLTADQVKAYRLADNRTAEFAEWDLPLLKFELGEIQGVDLSAFEFGELVTEFEETSCEEGTGDSEPQVDRAGKLREKWGTELGMAWQIGNHRLVCGDSTNAEHVKLAIVEGGGNQLMMVTDPPYGVEYDADWRNHAFCSDGSPTDGRAIGKVTNDDRSDWREAWELFTGDVAYVWHADVNSPVVALSLDAAGFDRRALVVWVKQQMVIGRGDYHHQHEPCWYCVRCGKPGMRTDDRKQTTVWQIDKPHKSETGHSTQKPLECMARPMRNHTCPHVYDPFLGSGTTMVAAQNLERRCFGLEINPGYCAVILQRMTDAFPEIKIERIA